MLRIPALMTYLMISAAVLGGCSQSQKTANQKNRPAPAPEKKTENDINSVNAVPSEGQGLKSPAKKNLGSKFDSSLDPGTVTSTYLKSLRKAFTDPDSLKTANELLTAKARNATHLANVDVSLPGSENANYVIHQPLYVTNEKNVAHVLTSWTDEVDNQKYKYDVTWVLKHEANIGWRVSGMITTGETKGDTVVFNFEDTADIVRKGTPGPDEPQTANKNSKTKIR